MNDNNIALEGFASLLSDEVRNDKVAKSFITASVNLANITAELSQHLEAPAFEALKARVVDFFILVDEVMKVVTPEEKLEGIPPDQAEEVVLPFSAEDVFPTVEEAPAKKVDPSVAALFASMPSNLKQHAVKTMKVDLQSARMEDVREDWRLKFKTVTWPSQLIVLVRQGVTAGQFLPHLEAHFGESFSEYEAASAYAEVFRVHGGILI